MKWQRTPQQARSRDKLQRILRSTEKLLAHTDFEKLSIADIMRESGAATGTFYTRFADKDELLQALYETHMGELHENTKRLLDPVRWNHETLSDIVTAFVTYTVRFHRRKRGLLRALVMRSHRQPGDRYEQASERGKSTVARVGQLILARQHEVGHPDPRLAGELGFLSVLGAVREKILFSESVGKSVRISDRRLAQELSRSFTAYLDVRPKPGGPDATA